MAGQVSAKIGSRSSTGVAVWVLVYTEFNQEMHREWALDLGLVVPDLAAVPLGAWTPLDTHMELHWYRYSCYCPYYNPPGVTSEVTGKVKLTRATFEQVAGELNLTLRGSDGTEWKGYERLDLWAAFDARP